MKTIKIIKNHGHNHGLTPLRSPIWDKPPNLEEGLLGLILGKKTGLAQLFSDLQSG